MIEINVAEIIKESDSKFLKSLPNFVIKLITKLVKQDELNFLLNKYAEYEGVELLAKYKEYFDITIDVDGLENLPDNGKCFFVANHPFGFIDGLVLTNIVGQKYGRLKAIGNNVFNFAPNLQSMIASVNVFGKNQRENFIALEKVYNSDVPITHFPFGLVSRIHKCKIQDKYWNKSFVTKAISAQRNVVPIRFFGRNSSLFYFIYLLRRLLGIKINLELVLLPRELFRKKGGTIKVSIGKMIPYQDFDKSRSHKEWAEKIRSDVYNMKKE